MGFTADLAWKADAEDDSDDALFNLHQACISLLLHKKGTKLH